MKTIKIILFALGGIILFYFGARVVRSVSVEHKPTELKTDHFVIFYRGIYTDEAEAVADTLEKHYDRIRTDLKDPQHETIHIFIHAAQSDFNKATGLLNSTANGTSRGPNEFHFVWTNWFTSIFPDDPVKTAIHEFTHCVQLNILITQAQAEWTHVSTEEFDRAFEEKFIAAYPQWFWEALCDYEAGVVNSISVKYAMTKNLSLKHLNNSNQIYNIGYTIIEYIVEKWGKEKLPSLTTSYVDIEAVLGVSEADFEKGWIEFVNEKY